MMFMENPSKPNILGIIVIQERGIPFLTNQSNKKTEGIWTLLKWTTARNWMVNDK